MNKVYPSLKYYARINPEVRIKREEILDNIEKKNIGILVDNTSILVDLNIKLTKITSDIINLRKNIKQNKRKKACIICYEKLQSVILIPCKHSEYCYKCVKKILEKNPLCPLCRSNIDNYIKL